MMIKIQAIWNMMPYTLVYWRHISVKVSVSFFSVSKKNNLRLKMGIIQNVLAGMLQQEIAVVGQRDI